MSKPSCHFCGRAVARSLNLHHTTPRSEGGERVVPAHILDFYHATQHLAAAADLIFGTPLRPDKTAWYEGWRLALRDEPGGVAGLIRSLI